MGATVTLSCPEGHVELEVTGEHAVRRDIEHLEDVALLEDYDKVPTRGCPECKRVMRLTKEP